MLVTDIQILFNSNPIPIKLNREEVAELWKFLLCCHNTGFSGKNDYTVLPHSQFREYSYRFHLKELCNKVFLLAKKEAGRKNFIIKVSEIEQRTLSIMFNRVECSPYMLQMQEKFIKNLKPL